MSFAIHAIVDWDTIVIGSGAGGLAAGLALARAGQRVMVLEQHYLPGGWTQSFTLEGYSFSPGVHYLGELGEGGGFRRMLEGLGLELSFWELNPDGYDHLLIDGERFDIPKGRQRFLARMLERFPQLVEELPDYFDRSDAIVAQLKQCDELLSFPAVLSLPWRASELLRWGFSTLGAMLDTTGIYDPMARAVLSARCGNHGLAPTRVSAPLHAAMIQHYLEGAYYPRGGARKIASAFIKELRRRGGDLRLRARVRRILVERGRVTGVELESGERIGAANVVSNADAATTYEKLLPPEYARRQRRHARRTVPSVSCLSLFAAVDMDLKARGYDSGNYWWYRDCRVNRHYERAERVMPSGPLDAVFLSVSSLKDPSARRDGHHTIEMFTFVPYASFARWRGTAPQARPDEYAALKQRLTDLMIEAGERVIPGMRDHLRFCELGTPLTNDHFCATRQGACYGSAKTPWQVGPFSFATRGPLKGLYLCGASTFSHGVAGAITSGLMVARDVLGLRTVADCLERADGSVRVAPAESVADVSRRVVSCVAP